MTADLSSAWEKFDRGNEHADVLLGEVNIRGESDADRLVGEANADDTQHVFHLERGDPLPAERWSLMLGDALFSYRCALDHSVYVLAVREAGADPRPGDTTLAFPLTADAGELADSDRRLGVMRPVVRAFVKRAQPHGGGDQPLLL